MIFALSKARVAKHLYNSLSLSSPVVVAEDYIHKKKDHHAKTRETKKERSIIRRLLFWCWCKVVGVLWPLTALPRSDDGDRGVSSLFLFVETSLVVKWYRTCSPHTIKNALC